MMKFSDRIQLMALKWDSTKEPHKTERFIDDVIHLINQLEGGEWLVFFLDHYLCRAKKNETYPTFMGGGIFDLNPPPIPLVAANPVEGEEEEEEDFEEAQPLAHSADTVGGSAVPRAPIIDYIKKPRGSVSSTATSAEKRFGEVPPELLPRMWPKKAQRLDAILHSTLLTLVSGPKSDYIRNVQRPSLIMALSNLWINDQVTRCDRQMRAFETMQKLEYKSDIAAFNVAAHKAITELAASGATMESIMMICLRNAFHSRGQYIRMEIGKDMDDNPDMAISQVLDFLHKYCNMVSSSGEGGGKLPPKEVNNLGAKGGKGGKGNGKGAHKDKGGSNKKAKGDKDTKYEFKKKDKKEDKPPPSKEESSFNIDDVKKWWEETQSSKTQKKKSESKKDVKFVDCGTVTVESNTVEETQHKTGEVWVSLFDGSGCGAKTMHPLDPNNDTYIGVESNAIRRRIADYGNPVSDTFPGISRVLGHEVKDITREDIKKLGRINGLFSGWPCRNLSWLRTRKGKDGRTPTKDERNGLRGAQSGLYYDMKRIWGWIKEFNPDATFFLENVVFNDMKDQWDEVCRDFGQPIIVNSKNHSYSHRKRAFWVSWATPPDLFEDMPPLDPNECLDEGRTFDLKNGMRTMTASWRGDPDDPEQFTSVPIRIVDKSLHGYQRIKSHEAERLHHLQPGCTAAPGVTEADRLSAIGDGWDLLITRRIWEYYPFKAVVPGAPTLPDGVIMTTEELDVQTEMLIALMENLEDEACFNIIEEMQPCAKQIRAFRCFITSRANRGNPTYVVNHAEGFAVLDSGSSRHVSRRVKVTDPTAVTMLRGFSGETKASGGTGDLNVRVETTSGAKININFDDADQVDTASHDLLSLGKMIKDGWSFHLDDSDHLKAWSPKGEEIVLALTDSDLLSLPLSGGEVNQISRLMDKPSATFLHRTLNHGSAMKICKTLEHTQGYKAKGVPDVKCPSCALTKSMRRAIGRGRLSEINVIDSDESSPSNSEEDDDAPVAKNSTDEGYDSMPELLRGSSSEDSDSSSDSSEEDEVIYPQRGDFNVKRVPVKKTPRHDPSKLRPWEVFYIDNKSFNAMDPDAPKMKHQTLIMIDVATLAIRIKQVDRKADNGKAFEALLAQEGISNLPYKCTVYADGCGSMKIIQKRCEDPRLNVHFESTPPHNQSLNEAEKICNHTWNSAMAVICDSQTEDGAPPWKHFNHALHYVVYVHERMATTDSRGWKTPYEGIHGVKPDISHLQPFWTTAYVTAPRKKREKWAAQGEPPLRAEEGNFIGFQSINTKTYKVLLKSGSVVHSRSVQFNSDPPVAKNSTAIPEEERFILLPDLPDDAPSEGVLAQRINPPPPEMPSPGGAHEADPSDLGDFEDELIDVQVEHMPEMGDEDDYDSSSPSITPPHRHEERERRATYFQALPSDAPRLRSATRINLCEEALHELKTMCGPYADELQAQPREAFVNVIELLSTLDESINQELVIQEKLITECCHILNKTAITQPDVVAHSAACDILAVQGQHDVGWAKALSGPDRKKVIEAYEKEMASLCDTILERVLEGDDDYKTALKEAVSGRLILDVKRKLGTYKARGVKQGFKENILWADGPGFNYYSSVAKLFSARVTIFRPHRRGRSICVIDVATAYLQAHQFEGFIKYIVFKNPITGVREYYRQHGPIYGEKSSAVRWENTIAPWLEEPEQGFIRGENERCIFWHPERDLTICLYVDDCLIDGDEDDIKWFLERINTRFKCKEAEWLTPTTPLDYLGMEVSMDSERVYICMEQYILNMVKMLRLEGNRRYSTPIGSPIDSSAPPLSPHERKRYMQALGCVGWLVNTARPDVAYAHSRIAQHMANPTTSAWEAIKRVCLYLRDTANLALSAPLWEVDITHCRDKHGKPSDLANTDAWAWFTDSDFAGNQEVQNNRRSQNGYLAILNGAPVLWGSKVSSVAFAHPKIGESHADVSSAAAEIYGAANATYDFLHLTYVAEEAGIEVKLPIILQGDNSAAESFINNSSARTKLKHIDCRQEWVRMLRNKEVLLPIHVSSADNLADLFTKILDRQVFEKLRDLIMVRRDIDRRP